MQHTSDIHRLMYEKYHTPIARCTIWYITVYLEGLPTYICLNPGVFLQNMLRNTTQLGSIFIKHSNLQKYVIFCRVRANEIIGSQTILLSFSYSIQQTFWITQMLSASVSVHENFSDFWKILILNYCATFFKTNWAEFDVCIMQFCLSSLSKVYKQ